MRTRFITVFFYGSFMSSQVLRDNGVTREVRPLEVTMLEGFEIALSPSATLVPSTKDVVYGVITELTQEELDLLSAPRLAQRLQTQIGYSEEEQPP